MNKNVIITSTVVAIKELLILSMLAVACILSVLWIETKYAEDDLQKKPCDTRSQQSEIKHDKTSKENCFL